MANLARQLRQEQQEQTIVAPKKRIKTKSWISPGEKILGITLELCLFWFRPYHFQSGFHIPSK